MDNKNAIPTLDIIDLFSKKGVNHFCILACYANSFLNTEDNKIKLNNVLKNGDTKVLPNVKANFSLKRDTKIPNIILKKLLLLHLWTM